MAKRKGKGKKGAKVKKSVWAAKKEKEIEKKKEHPKAKKFKPRYKESHLLVAVAVILIAVATLVTVLVFMSAGPFFTEKPKEVLSPGTAKDSDGTSNDRILENIQNNYDNLKPAITGKILASKVSGLKMHEINLKTEPYGFVEVGGWNGVSDGHINKLVVHVLWRTDVGEGAGNIYVGYSFGGPYIEKGPFGESEREKDTIIELEDINQDQMSNLRIRWRGKDLDYMLPAFGYVTFLAEVY